MLTNLRMSEIMALKTLVGTEGKYREHSLSGGFTQTSVDNNASYVLEKKVWFWAGFVAAQVFGLVSVILMIVWVMKYRGGLDWSIDDQKLNYHPLFMTIGLVYLFGNGIVVYRVAPSLPKTTLKIIHGAHHFLAIVSAVVGLVAIFEYKKRAGSMDMYSLHSWIGMSAAILFTIQYIFGFSVFMLPSTPLRFRQLLLPFHRFFGIGILALAIASVLTGLAVNLTWTKGYGKGTFTPAGVVGCCFALFVVVYGFLISFLSTNEAYRRQPLPQEMPAIN